MRTAIRIVLPVALIAVLICSMSLAPPAGANVDQCAPPGIESASALPFSVCTNRGFAFGSGR